MGVAGEAALPSLNRANAKPTAVNFVEVETRALVPPTTLAEHAGPLFTAHRGAILALHRSRRHDEAVSSFACACGGPAPVPQPTAIRRASFCVTRCVELPDALTPASGAERC